MPDHQYSSREEIDAAYTTLFSTFRTGRTKDLAWRRWQLKQLWWLLEDNEQRILEALKGDLSRHPIESFASDIYFIKKDILNYLTHLDEWTSATKLNAGIIMGFLGKAHIRKEPLGVALIIGAWNFPFLLLLQPLIAAIASGKL
jgi:aldehyde dehydrogenase (NAD+)